MRKLFIIAGLAALAAAAPPAFAFDSVEIGEGSAWSCDGPCRLAAVRASSTVAAGTVALVAVDSWEVYTNATETVTDTTVLWQRVITNATETVTNTYPGQVVYTPPPAWKIASEGWITNTSTRTVTRAVKTGATLATTNALASFTCSAGSGYAGPTNIYIGAGEKVSWSGTAKGRVTLILER